MTDFTPWSGLAGGLMIGAAAVLLLMFNGRIAGISGIVGGLLGADRAWRVAFLAGLVAGPFLGALFAGRFPAVSITDSVPLLIVAGLLVGFGTRLGSGCTSGHGVCGLARLSPRSLVATILFIAVAGATTFVLRHLLEVT